MRKWGKSVTIVFCVRHILRFKKFLIENDTGFKINREKAKIRSSRKLPDIRYYHIADMQDCWL